MKIHAVESRGMKRISLIRAIFIIKNILVRIGIATDE